jgi:cytochrome c oxidase subunit 3
MDGTIPEPGRRVLRKPVVPNGVLGMLIFITAEVMLFAGMMSAFTIVRASSMPLMWPPAGQPRLPAQSTAFNTVALLLSGVALFFAHRAFVKSKGAVAPLAAAVALGATFVVLQGREWVALLAQGLTLTSSNLGSFFYLIVGTHAIHAVVALGLLAWALLKLRAGTLKAGSFYAVQALWYFVVGLWPVIYSRVYFG